MLGNQIALGPLLLLVAIIVAALVIAEFVVTIDPSLVIPQPSQSNVIVPSCQQQTFHTNDGVRIEEKTSQTNKQSEDIGVSDGRFAFDLQGPDKLYKCEAALSLKAHQNSAARDQWGKALKHLSNDAEVLIYQEDQRIQDHHLPYISFIVGATLTGNNVNLGRDLLQGAYATQKSYNDQHPNSPQIRLLIANFGSQPENASTLVQWMLQTARQAQQHVEGIMGLPPFALSSQEITTRLSGSFPVVLPTGSASDQENISNFFHVAPSLQREGEIGADYVTGNCPYVPNGSTQKSFDCPGNKILVLSDDTDTYSNSLAIAFEGRLKSDTGSKMIISKPYKVGDAKSIISVVESLKNGSPDQIPDLIYFAGNAADANTLLEQLPSLGAFNNLRVLGADELYELGGYKLNLFRRLDFCAFAYPDEWRWLGLPQPSFFTYYKKFFAGNQTGYGYDRADNDVILAHDALSVLLRGSEIASMNWTKPFSPADLQSALHTIIKTQGYQGVSGVISFGPDGNPVDKAVVILRVDAIGQIGLQGVQGPLN